MVMTLQQKKPKQKTWWWTVQEKHFIVVFALNHRSKWHAIWDPNKDKPKVLRVIKFPKESKEPRLQFTLLTNKGNRAHNNRVLEKGKGLVIPPQQCCALVKASDYLTENYLKRKSLWRYM